MEEIVLKSSYNKDRENEKLKAKVSNLLEEVNFFKNELELCKEQKNTKFPERYEIRMLRKYKGDIVGLISNYTKLTKRGQNFFGICPFHDDKKNQIFSVNPDKQEYKCWGCGVGGTAREFMWEMFRLSIWANLDKKPVKRFKTEDFENVKLLEQATLR